MRLEKIGNCALYLADCLDVLPTLVGVDVVITDPPYGIGIGSGTTSRLRGKAVYQTDKFSDTPEYIRAVCVGAVSQSLAIAGGRGLVTPGVPCMFDYPRPRAVGGFYQPAAVGMSPWGFAGYNPVLFYGKDPRDGKGQSSVMTTLTEPPSESGHPCAKPMGAMMWMVAKGSLESETVLDPFMGSGTTGVACVNLGRKFIGIEIEPIYFDIACRRVEEAYRQPRLFAEPVAKVKQDRML